MLGVYFSSVPVFVEIAKASFLKIFVKKYTVQICTTTVKNISAVIRQSWHESFFAIQKFWMNATILKWFSTVLWSMSYVCYAIVCLHTFYIFPSLFQILSCKVKGFYLYLMQYYFYHASQCLQTSVISKKGWSDQANHRMSLRLWNKTHLDLMQSQRTQPVISITALQIVIKWIGLGKMASTPMLINIQLKHEK